MILEGLSVGRWLAVVGFLAVFVVGSLLRVLYIEKDYGHPDEIITVQVVDHMNRSGDWDTNWKKADLPPLFKCDQYNFSSYLYSVFLFAKFVGRFDLYTYRLFSAFCAGLAIVALSTLAFRTRAVGVTLVAVFLTALAPILVQDAHYGRPESFVTLLTMLVVCLCWPAEKSRVWPALAAAILVGVLCACKASMAFFVWMPLVPLVYAWRTGRPSRRWPLVAAAGGVIVLTAAGFAATVPGAVANPRAWLDGLLALMRQYSGLHPGHSHLAGGPVGDLYFMYLGTTLGWTTLVLFAVGCWSEFQRRSWITLLLLYFPTIVYVGYFSSKPVFFERNISHVVPLYLMGAAYGLRATVLFAERFLPGRTHVHRLVALLLLVAASAAPADCSRRLVFKMFSRKEETAREQYRGSVVARFPAKVMLNLTPVALATGELDAAIRGGNVPALVRLWDPGGDTSVHKLREFIERYDVAEVGHFRSTFKRVPMCTLRTYGSCTDRYYLVSGFRPPPPRNARSP